jgi:hypothetical protein
MVYNPFAVAEESSERFVAWQKERAMQAVYGQPQLPARSRLHNRTWGLGMFLLSTALIAGLIVALQQPRRKVCRFLAKAFVPFLGSLVGLVIALMLIGPAYGITSMQGLDAYPMVVLGNVAGSVGLSGSVYLVLSILVLVTGYFLVGRTFARVEPDRTPEKTPWHDYRF